ncbi:sugar ABC transporter permease [Demequina sp. SYSU T00039]|uniref:Sugar ABC transporter permease n=1 Tax=Demequina lignilytica TaxID=3051663 RepID=A0AAW7M9H8_9MICO|nr:MULTISPECIES: sugar ABC transporter permease [unclassified Demequina]MDN4478707.1 sugar ABC transporter permease [Demequina sp. SYSU T00039-1]MDN4483259.1 sugar ABC transporter permease [Demequina sp. SYSU T0a273]MDN4488685.1 sugar ABC transporter permease [Demequina sp. SYSU T00039]MDN4491859.1 sugar ABC transporter permease [Demequina sp. SYSU T00068]
MFLADNAPKRGRDVIQLLLFVAPALLLLAAGMIWPALQTIWQSVTSKAGEFVGLDNFVTIFTDPTMQVVMRNTIVWVIFVPTFSTIVGLAYALFIDRSRGEKILKSLVFMPMAISFVGASIIWGFMYTYRSEGFPQIGLLNQILVWLGLSPYQFVETPPWNTFFLLVVMAWIQTGFAMVVLSAAIKGVPAEIVEAAELDGATAWQRFLNVTLPWIRGSLVVVVTTITISTLKVFDIVRTMTGGQYNTSVVANEMYTRAFRLNQPEIGAALAVLLFVLVLPIVVYNIRVLRAHKEAH